MFNHCGRRDRVPFTIQSTTFKTSRSHPRRSRPGRVGTKQSSSHWRSPSKNWSKRPFTFNLHCCQYQLEYRRHRFADHLPGSPNRIVCLGKGTVQAHPTSWEYRIGASVRRRLFRSEIPARNQWLSSIL